MKNITNLKIRIDKSLNKYEKVGLFPKKLAKANKMLKEIGASETGK